MKSDLQMTLMLYWLLLYYAVMCLKRFFPGWGITMQTHHLRNTSPPNINGNLPDMNRDSSDIDNYSETEPLITEV